MNTLVVSARPSGLPGGTATISGDDCAADERVHVSIDGHVVGRTTSDEQGRFTTDVALPDEIGRHRLAVECGDEAVVRPIDIVVSTSGGSPGGVIASGGVFAFFVLLALLLRQGQVNTARRSDSDDDDALL